VLEEFRYRENADPEELGQEEDSDKNKSDGSDPLVTRHCHPDMSGALPGHPDKLFSGDVGCDEREADQIPEKASASQEIILARFLLFAALVETDPNDKADERQEKSDIKPA